MFNTDFGKPAPDMDARFRFDSFDNGQACCGVKNHLPAMGWNSWNAFGSGNTEALTKEMADRLVSLGLDQLGYSYVVLDDGCYKASRVDSHLANDQVKFPSGFRALSDYIHAKGLKFGMYNDVGSHLCSGLAVGTCGYEELDTADYAAWGVDFLKVDNCYNVWDNATFSNPENAKYTFAPSIRSVRLTSASGHLEEDVPPLTLLAVQDGILTGTRAYIEDDYVTGIGTFDGTGPDQTPVGAQSSELHFVLDLPEEGDYDLCISYRPGAAEGCGAWLQLAVDQEGQTAYVYDDLLASADPGHVQTEGSQGFLESSPIRIHLSAGQNVLRLMNHRRQENTLSSYAKIRECFDQLAAEGKGVGDDFILSICEWGKTQPQNWGYKVGDSWRILNDITFQVGSDGDPGHGSWEGPYTTSVTAQYNKAVIMDEFAGLTRGWNDPDMLMIGMNGLTETMCRTHMAMWCMLNAPLMLGMDLRRVSREDWIYRIISNQALISLNQDPLGVQAKRIYTTKQVAPDTSYIRDNDRIDVLAKPLFDSSLALSFINVGMGERADEISVSADLILSYLGEKMTGAEDFLHASAYEVTDLWTGQTRDLTGSVFALRDFLDGPLLACDNVTLLIRPRRA